MSRHIVRAGPRILRSLLALAPLTLFATALAAQEPTGFIRGKVLDARTQRPVADAQVTVIGSTAAGLTSARGEFFIGGVALGSRAVNVRRLGYTRQAQQVTITAGVTAELNFALVELVSALDQVVVTGTGGDSEKRVLGNSITSLDVADISSKASVVNITDILQSRAPGVQLLPGSGTPGTGADIRIRGTGTLQGANGATRPVFFIDGVRMNDQQLATFSPTGAGAGGAGGSQIASALDLINPNDIESIEVIKGPAAATLYGADAAAGVIQVITKKGRRGQQRAQWTIRTDVGSNSMALSQPDNFTNCDSLKEFLPNGSLNTNWPGCRGVPRYTVLSDNPFNRSQSAFREGGLSAFSLGARGGGDRYSYFLTYNRSGENGVQFSSFTKANTGRANFTLQLTPTLDVQLNLSYLDNLLRLPIGDESGNGILLSGNRGRPGFTTASGTGDPGWRTILPEFSNAYRNLTENTRIIAGTTLNWRPTAWFRNRLTLGFDRSTGLATLISEPNSADTPLGLSAQRVQRPRDFTIDYAGTLDYGLSSNWRGNTVVGTQITGRRTESIFAQGVGLGAPDVTLIQSAQTITASNNFVDNNSVGVFVQQQFGWKNRFFTTFAVRADDNSAFGVNFDAIIFPKASFSYVLSEEPAFKSLMQFIRADEFKLRSSWGMAGRAPQPFAATRTYGVDRVTLGNTTGSAIRTTSFGNPELKPERARELEFGFDATLFKGRTSVEFTSWNKTTSDLIASQPIPPSLGFVGSRFVNLGSINNRGIEFLLRVTPVQSKLLTWESSVNLSTFRNRLVSFDDSTKLREVPISQAYGVVQEHRAGFPLGGYWTPGINRNADGSVRVTASGAVDTTAQRQFIGNPLPEREIGFGNTLTFGRYVRLYALLDYKGAFYVFNGKERNRCQAANDNCARNNFVPNEWRDPRTAADSLGARELLVNRSQLLPFIEPADFIKLRDISMTFTVPPAGLLSFPGKPGSASFTFTVRNPAILWTRYSGVDPEVNGYANRNNFIRVDQYSMPQVRRAVISVNLTY